MFPSICQLFTVNLKLSASLTYFATRLHTLRKVTSEVCLQRTDLLSNCVSFQLISTLMCYSQIHILHLLNDILKPSFFSWPIIQFWKQVTCIDLYRIDKNKIWIKSVSFKVRKMSTLFNHFHIWYLFVPWIMERRSYLNCKFNSANVQCDNWNIIHTFHTWYSSILPSYVFFPCTLLFNIDLMEDIYPFEFSLD